MKQVHEMTDDELKAHRAQLEADLAEAQKAEVVRARLARIKRNNFFLEHKETLLMFMEHGRTSCSDENPSNGYEHNGYFRCNKCALMRLDNHTLADMDIDFDVIVKPAGKS